MTSAIVSSTIDADYPVSGQDNDSQGFRDNFSVTKDGLATAAAEITVLQNSTAKLDADNDFGGNVIDNATTNRLYGSVYPTTSTPTTNVSLANGEYQRIQVAQNCTLTFTDWPETDKFAKVRLELKSDGTTRTVSFSSEGGGIVRTEITKTLASAIQVNRKASTVATSSATFSFPTVAPGYTWSVGDLVFGTGLIDSATVGAQTSVTGSVAATTAPTTRPYTAINGLTSVVTTSTSAALISDGAKVKLSDNTGIQGLSTDATYYAYDADGTGFKLASSYADALAGVPISVGLRGTVSYTAIALNGRVTTASSAAGIPIGNKVTLSATTGLTGIVAEATYYMYSCDSNGFNIAASYADALLGTPITPATGTPFNGVGVATHRGDFSGTATATFREENQTNSNAVTVSSTTNMYVGMPIKFSGTGFGGLSPSVQYYITSVIDGSRIRISETKQGEPVTLTDSSAGGLTINDTTVLTVLCSSQIITTAAGLTITTSDGVFPFPFEVSSDVNKIRIVEAWTADGGTNIFLKYLGEFA
jgi:hypothetical protein